MRSVSALLATAIPLSIFAASAAAVETKYASYSNTVHYVDSIDRPQRGDNSPRYDLNLPPVVFTITDWSTRSSDTPVELIVNGIRQELEVGGSDTAWGFDRSNPFTGNPDTILSTFDFWWREQQSYTLLHIVHYSGGDVISFAPRAGFGETIHTYRSSSFGTYSGSISAIPEPMTYAMILAGVAFFGLLARRNQLRQPDKAT